MQDLSEVFGLAGKVAVVTGAGPGIGESVAEVLAQAGARVVLGDLDAQATRLLVGLVEEQAVTHDAASSIEPHRQFLGIDAGGPAGLSASRGLKFAICP